MRTFTNTELTKQQAVDLAKAHQNADAFTQKTYGGYDDKTGLWNGCSVGCMAKGSNHSGYESRFGIDRRIAYLSDYIFESLKQGEHKTFTLDLFEAIPENIDSKIVYYKFMHWLLVDSDFGVIRFSKNTSVIENIAVLYQRAIDGDYPLDIECLKARKDAAADAYAAAAAAADADATAYAAAADADAAAYAADAATAYATAAYAADAATAYATAAYAADAATAAAYATAAADAAAAAAADAAAAYAAAAAAADAAYAAAAADARAKHYQAMRDKLIQLFKESV